MYLNSFNKSIKIVFVRHGTTKFNEEDRVQGSSDIELSLKGKKEIENVKFKNFDFDLFYHSPLSRSKDTLFGIINKHNKDINELNIKEDILVTERKYGIFEGLTKKEIQKKFPKLYEIWNVNENIKADGIESIENVIDRIKLFISKIISYDYKNILVVTHSGFLYALYKYITNKNLKLKPDELNVKFLNCSTTELKINIISDKISMDLNVSDKNFHKDIEF